MFSAVWSVLGVVLIATALMDALWTTLTVSRAGWLSAYFAGSVARLAMKGPQRLAENASLLALCISFLMWFALLWIGWTLFFCGSSVAVVQPLTTAPANWIGRIYFAGFTITTLGVGDLQPGEGIWRMAAVLAATSGFVTLTLFITYALSVMTALNERRSLGTAVAHIASAPEDFLLLVRDGGAQALTTRLLSLTDRVESAAVQTDAYPVLEYSHVSDPERSFARAIVILGEVSLLLEHVAEGKSRLPSAVWSPLRNAVNLLVGEKFTRDTSTKLPERGFSPPVPNLDHLRREGIASNSQAEAAYQTPEVQSIRSRWAGWLRWHGRDWSLVCPSCHENSSQATTSDLC